MAIKYATNLNLAQNALLNALLHPAASAPSSPLEAQAYYNTTTKLFGWWNGTTWIYPGTSGNAILKGNGAGGFANAVASTDYAPATSGSALLKGNGSGGFASAVANTDYAPPASPTFTGTVTVPATVNPTDAAQKQYVDNAILGLSPTPSARAATTGAETFTVAAGTVTQITGLAVDGVTLAIGDVLLIKDAPAATGAGSVMSVQPGNGLYTVTGITTNITVARNADMAGTVAPAGAYTFTEAGTVNAGAGYVVTAPSSGAAFTYGTGSIGYVQFSGGGEITVGPGLTKTGNQISVAAAGLPVAQGGTGATTAAAARTSLAIAGFLGSVYQATGPASAVTAWNVTHNLNNPTPLVQVYDVTAGPNAGVQVIADVAITGVNTLTVSFAVAASINQYAVTVIG